MKRFPFNTAYTQMRQLYGLEINPDEFETLGLIAWDKIGNKQYRWYHYQTEAEKNADGSFYVDLPCNCDIIEAVTADYEDYQKTTPTTLAGNNQNGWIEGYVESRKYNTGFGYSSGKFIKYQQTGNTIQLADKFNKINILYKGVIVDEEGLPYLDVREIDAVAAFCAQAEFFKKGLITMNSGIIQMSQLLEQKWKLMCTQARVPEYINQNEMDEILNVSSSWDRKRFGKSFKPTR